VSDDGESLLAVRTVIQSSVWVGPADDPARSRAVTSRAFGKLDGSAGLAWTPDGRLVFVSFFNNSYSLWITSADGRDAKPLTSSGFVDLFPQMTSDGRHIVFESNRGGGTDVWRIDADGGRARALTTGGRSGQPSVTPDGRWVFFTSSADGAPTIAKVSIDGGPRSRWRTRRRCGRACLRTVRRSRTSSRAAPSPKPTPSV
jgi:sugar lactone lactonase YvrE